jgi:hypothetical protein
MKSKLILLATAAMLVATNAQAAFLSRESQRCASPRPLGIFKPRNAADNTVSSNCDVAANRVGDPVAQAKQPYQPITAPGMLIGVPHDTVTPLVQKEIDTATKQDPASLPAITRDPGLLQYLPEGYFATPYAIAAFNRLIRVEPSYAYPVNFKVLSGRPRTTTAVKCNDSCLDCARAYLEQIEFRKSRKL